MLMGRATVHPPWTWTAMRQTMTATPWTMTATFRTMTALLLTQTATNVQVREILTATTVKVKTKQWPDNFMVIFLDEDSDSFPEALNPPNSPVPRNRYKLKESGLGSRSRSRVFLVPWSRSRSWSRLKKKTRSRSRLEKKSKAGA